MLEQFELPIGLLIVNEHGKVTVAGKSEEASRERIAGHTRFLISCMQSRTNVLLLMLMLSLTVVGVKLV